MKCNAMSFDVYNEMQCDVMQCILIRVTQSSYPGATELSGSQGESAAVCGWRSLCQGICGNVHLHSISESETTLW